VNDPTPGADNGTVPPIAELRERVQGDKVHADRRWTYRLFRRISIYITWALLHTNVTANQVTVSSLIVAAAGLVLAAVSSPWVGLAGYVLLLTYHLLDRVDGEIARYRQTYSLHGIYLDNLGHYLTGGGVIIATTYRLAPLWDDPQVIWLIGVFGAFAAIMARIEKHAAFQLFAQYVLDRPSLAEGLSDEAGVLTRAATKADRADDAPEHRRGVLGVLRDGALMLTSFPVVLTFFIVGVTALAVTRDPTVAVVILFAVATIQVLTYLALEAVNVTQNLNTETRRLFEKCTRFEGDEDTGDPR